MPAAEPREPGLLDGLIAAFRAEAPIAPADPPTSIPGTVTVAPIPIPVPRLASAAAAPTPKRVAVPVQRIDEARVADVDCEVDVQSSAVDVASIYREFRMLEAHDRP